MPFFHYQFQKLPKSTLKEAEHELISLGLQHPYVIEEPTCVIIAGFTESFDHTLVHSKLKCVEPAEVDWQSQWEAHAPGFDGNIMRVKVGQQVVELEPGPGFGDLSHPTTQLMIEHIADGIGENVLDLGCGSGVLGCVALKCNVKQLYMVDIDEDALAHAKKNVIRNGCKATFSTKIEPQWHFDTILMNMIWQDQMSVFEACPQLRMFEGQWIISGILEEQRAAYLKWFDMQPLKESVSDGWIGFTSSRPCHPYRPSPCRPYP